jgi:hypothetical protein
VPSLALIAAGDVVYNGIHPYLAETNAQTRLEWIDALYKLDALEPRAVVAGHRSPTTTTTRGTSPRPGRTWGSDFQAGGPDGSEKASSETGRWVAAITAACCAGRSAANTSWSFAGSIANSVAFPAPSGVGYCSATCAVERTLSLEAAVASARRSPSSGANAATKTSPTTLPTPVAALEIDRAAVGVADGEDRPGDLLDEAGDVSGVVGDAAQRVRRRGHLDPGRPEALDDAIPARRVGEGTVDENDGERGI